VTCGTAWWFRRKYRLQQETKEGAWQHDGEAQRSAMEVLQALTSAPVGERAKYIRQVIQILKDFPDKAVIQHKGFVAVEAICRAQHGNTGQVQAAGAIPVILTALEKHLRVRAVQRSGLAALACLAKVSKQQIFDLGGIPMTLASISKFKRDPAVQVSGAMALGAMCLNSERNRKSVAKYGGPSVLLQALERHVERPEVLIAASETVALLIQGDSGLRKQMMPSLGMIQGIVARYESAKDAAERKQKAKDCEVVLRSLRKLEAQLADLATAPDDEECSEVGTPRMGQNKEQGRVEQANAGQANELQDRISQWKKKKKASRV